MFSVSIYLGQNKASRLEWAKRDANENSFEITHLFSSLVNNHDSRKYKCNRENFTALKKDIGDPLEVYTADDKG